MPQSFRRYVVSRLAEALGLRRRRPFFRCACSLTSARVYGPESTSRPYSVYASFIRSAAQRRARQRLDHDLHRQVILFARTRNRAGRAPARPSPRPCRIPPARNSPPRSARCSPENGFTAKRPVKNPSFSAVARSAPRMHALPQPLQLPLPSLARPGTPGEQAPAAADARAKE